VDPTARSPRGSTRHTYPLTQTAFTGGQNGRSHAVLKYRTVSGTTAGSAVASAGRDPSNGPKEEGRFLMVRPKVLALARALVVTFRRQGGTFGRA
jgi:hypothetical protein